MSLYLQTTETENNPTSVAVCNRGAGMCFGCVDGGGPENVKQPLHSRASDDISLPNERQRSPIPTIATSPLPYEPPTTTSSSSSQQSQPSQKSLSHTPAAPSPSAATIASLEKTYHKDFSSMPIPEKANETALTGWLFYRTGTVITSYEKAFFVLEEGYLYLYNQPKRSAASEKGDSPPPSLPSSVPSASFSSSLLLSVDLVRDPINLTGGILSKVSLPDRPFCIELENNLFIDARTSAAQVLWINALLTEIDTASLKYLQSGDPKARDNLALWFGKLLGRKQTCITVLQQSFTVVRPYPLSPPSLIPLDEAFHEGGVSQEPHASHESGREW